MASTYGSQVRHMTFFTWRYPPLIGFAYYLPWHNQEVWSSIVVQPASRSAALLSVRQSRGRSGCCQVERSLATRKESWPACCQQQMGENRIQRAFNFGSQKGKPSNNGLLTRGKGERMNGKRLNSSFKIPRFLAALFFILSYWFS